MLPPRAVPMLWIAACAAPVPSPSVAPGSPIEAPVGPPAAGSPRAALGLALAPGLVPGETAVYTVTGALPGETVGVVGSTHGLGASVCPARIGGVCLGLAAPVRLAGQGIADGAGVASVDVGVPATMAVGTAFSAQAVIQRGAGGALSVVSEPRQDVVHAPWVQGLTARPANPTCLAPHDPPVRDRAVDVERAFPAIPPSKPVEMIQPPGDPDHWWLAEKTGLIWRFDDDDAVATRSQVIDLTGTVYASLNEMGLLGFAFHPSFETNGEVYLSYNTFDGVDFWDQVVRYTSNDGGLTLDPASAQPILTVEDPAGNHNGGKIAFGPDGYLYFGLGDGGSAGDPWGNGQDPHTLLATIMRLDVDSAVPYAIPPDNPFADGVAGAPEVWAYGLRNPWRWSFDRGTGDLWAGDVGQYDWEEIDQIRKGGNYGWSLQEGPACFDGAACDTAPGLVEPVLTYQMPSSAAVIGGFVYRGSAIPDLVGTYVFADYYGFALWGVAYDGQGAAYREDLLSPAVVVPSAFAEDLDGELYVLDYTRHIWRIVPAATGPAVDDFPTTLSATGCVDPADPSSPAAGLVPYDVRSPLWSDGAAKSRWFAVPDGATIDVDADGDFVFPIGSVLVKTFAVADRPVETRLLVRHDDGSWAGYAYAWDETGADATLVEGGRTVDTDAGPWRIPSSAECLQCHTDAAGRVLGLEVAQLNRTLAYPGGATANQLYTLDRIGLLSAPLGGTGVYPDQLPAIPDPADPGTPIDARARGYLHANCSGCHRPGGPGLGDLDLQWTAVDPGGCGLAPAQGDLGVPGALVIDPGSASNSVMSLRLHTTSAGRMPPLGTTAVDPLGAAVVDGWIDGMTACP